LLNLNLCTIIPLTKTKILINNTEKRIVVWGSNLELTIGLKRYTKIIRQMITLPSYQFSVSIGLILSDGWLEVNRNVKQLKKIK
jgi:hypothetical protein